MANKNTIDECILKELHELSNSARCKGEDCEKCGWNPVVLKKRQEHLQENGLSLCSDGLRRLIM